MLFHLEFERRLLEDLPEEVESELLAVEHVIALVSLDVLQPQLQLGLDLVQRFHQSSNDYCTILTQLICLIFYYCNHLRHRKLWIALVANRRLTCRNLRSGGINKEANPRLSNSDPIAMSVNHLCFRLFNMQREGKEREKCNFLPFLRKG